MAPGTYTFHEEAAPTGYLKVTDITFQEAMSQEDFSSQDQAKLTAADKEAAEEAAKVRSDLIATLEKIEKSTIDDINKDATITDKEAAIKAAKEVIGKDAILKAIEEGDIEASDLLDDFLAEDSEQVTPAEAMSQEAETLDKRDQVFTYNVKTSVAQDATASGVSG
ncbi:hypothetical protein V470_10945 [Streptococcus sp. VT 162]|nr:hypothetical protein V470_10945 [Streptococcus sp. VT 162]